MSMDMLQSVEAHLRRPTRRLRFTPSLESQFNNDTHTVRTRHLAIMGLFALAMYNFFLINDFLVRREVFDFALLIRLGVVTPVALIVLWCILRPSFASRRDGLISVALVTAMIMSCVLCSNTQSVLGLFDPFAFSLILLAGNIIFTLRFPFALLSTVVNFLILVFFLAQHPAMPSQIKSFAIIIALATGVLSLLANYRQEASERFSYLMLLRETLRTSLAKAHNQTLTSFSYTDALTQMPNRRHFDERSAQRWRDALADRQYVALLMIDIDNFKAYNDHYGHPEGDRCLRQVAEAMQQQIRPGQDLIARFGGEEFVVMFYGLDAHEAVVAAERLRTSVESRGIVHGGSNPPHVVTVSIGMVVERAEPSESVVSLLACADGALYEAKRGGKNNVVLSTFVS